IRASQLEPGEDDTEEAGILRVAGRFMYPLSAGARFDQRFSTESSILGDNNFIAESESALVANLVSSLAMKLAVSVRYLKEPPSGKKSTDTETSVTLIYPLYQRCQPGLTPNAAIRQTQRRPQLRSS